MIKVGVIGYGFSAQTFHLPFILSSSEFEFSALSTTQSEKIKQTHPHVSCFSTPEALIASNTVSLVVITAPNAVHFSLVKMCLLHGLHVIVEKPMTATSAQAQALNQLAQSRGLVLSVFHNRRWDGDFLTVKKLLAEKTVGDLRVFESRFDRCRPTVGAKWKEAPGIATGVWYDLGSHLVDQAVNLFGLPLSVTARCLALRERSEVTDYFHVQLHYADLEVILHSSPFTHDSSARFALHGSKGSFIKCGTDVQESQLKQGMKPKADEYGTDSPQNFGRLFKNGQERIIATQLGCYQHYYRAISQAINHGQSIPVTADEGAKVIKILELALLSSNTGKTLALD